MKNTLTILLVVCLSTVLQGQIYVKVSATGTNSGSSWTNAYTNLQSAISAARSGDEIWVAKGTYKPTTGTDRSAYFYMKAGVNIYGSFKGDETLLSQRTSSVMVQNTSILSGDLANNDVITGSGSTLSITGSEENSYEVFTNYNNGLSGGNALLDGFTIIGGANNGMHNYKSSPVISNVTFWGNFVGMTNDEYCWTVLRDATFSCNSSGGMVNRGSCTPWLTNVVFSGNNATDGGGIFSLNSTATLINVTFSSNKATNNGGGIYNINSGMSLSNVVFTANSATRGGAIYNNNSASSLNNVTVYGNSASIFCGGVIDINNGSSSITNSIFWGNTNSQISISGTITNSDISGGYFGTGNINQDPLFVNAANPAGIDGIFRTSDDGLVLLPSSPARDLADVSTATTTDILGEAVFGLARDMGAYETQTAVLSANLFYFTALNKGYINILTWETASELNNLGFDIERSADAINFEKIGFVKSKGQNSTYDFTDDTPLSISYYRLRQKDFDGAETVSKTITLKQTPKGDIKIYPNPSAQNTIYIDFDPSNETAEIEVFNWTGQLLLASKNVQPNAPFDVSSLAAGSYLIAVRLPHQTFRQRFVKN